MALRRQVSGASKNQRHNRTSHCLRARQPAPSFFDVS